MEAKVTAACDATDGAVDGVVWDHRLCKYDVAKLRCPAQAGPDCLTDPEIRSIKAIADGPRGADGALLAEPMPLTNTTAWAMFTGPVPPPWTPDPAPENRGKTSSAYVLVNTTARGLFGDKYDVLTDFDLKNPAHVAAWRRESAKIGFHGEPDLTPFSRTGGKAILWVGVSDPCCSNVGMEKYVRELDAAMGRDRVASFISLYQIPGMGHCGGGTGPWDAPDRLLWTLVDWVEGGKAPAGVEMHRGADRAKFAFGDVNLPRESGVSIPPPAGPSRDFLVCPYPLVSVFDASKANIPGAVDQAANWSCKAARS